MSEKSLATVDITSLVPYLDKINDIASINKMMGAVYLRDFIQGQDIAGLLLAKAIRADGLAKAKLEQAESIAFLDRSSDYLKARNIKDTAEARKMYVSVDPDVMQATDKKAQTEALVSLMKTKLSVLRQAHDDIKKLLYGDQHLTPYEGM